MPTNNNPYTENWAESFEIDFNIGAHNENTNSHYFLIEGECRYLQKLGDCNLAIECAHHREYFNRHNCSVYNNIDAIAFLVTDWIKIQDSLEMIFNLLTGSHIRSLKMLSYLRENKIPAHEFAFYLYAEHRVILLNRFTAPPKNPLRTSQINRIKNIINALTHDCHVLIVGDRDHKSIRSWSRVAGVAKVYHPSGAVLNTKPIEYYQTWYELNNDYENQPDPPDFPLDLFSRLRERHSI